MAEKVLMLALSPTMETGTIASWTKQEGDEVSTGDVICEVETDKATMEYESVQEGTLRKIVVGEGESAAVEQPIAIIGDPEEDISDLLEEIEQSEEQASGAATGGSDARTGPSSDGGSGAQAGPTASGGAHEAAAGARGSTNEGAVEGPSGDVTPAPAAPVTDQGRLKASPLARRLARDAGIALERLSGSGPQGRIVKRDIEEAIESGAGREAAGAGGDSKAATPGAAFAATPTAAELSDESIPLSSKRQVIARRLAESKFSAPHFYLKTAVFTETMMAGRKALNAGLDYKVSVNAFLMKFAAEAIKRHPVINSSWEGDTIHRFGSIDIGLAVALDDGLITPIVRNCGAKGVVEIDSELSNLISRARSNKLAPEEFTGATFSISSLGTFGIEEFTAIINPPGSAILAVGQMQKTPVVAEDDTVVVRNQMKLTLSCDHRVIDGAKGAGFLTELKALIEDPIRALY